MFGIKKGALAVGLIGSLSVGNSIDSLAASVPPPMKRTIYMAAIEPKGSANVEKETFPKAPLPAGGGYGLKAPDKEGKWEVETYAWLPGSITVYQGDEVTLQVAGINGITVYQGDEVTLQVAGINGAEHAVSIEGYGLKYVVKRGEITTVSFKANKAGIFEIICHTHRPSMTGQLIVLVRPQK